MLPYAELLEPQGSTSLESLQSCECAESLSFIFLLNAIYFILRCGPGLLGPCFLHAAVVTG